VFLFQVQLGVERLKRRLKTLELEMVTIVGDGNCQFRSISQQLFGCESHHEFVRTATVQYMCEHATHFGVFFEGGGEGAEFRRYLAKMRRAHCVFVERTHSIENTLYIEHVLTCEFARYLEKMRRGRTWGDELTLRGICNSFGCHIHVVTSTEKNWYLEYEPDTVLTDKQVFLCFVECVPLLVCRM
jgi:hypothetical protein